MNILPPKIDSHQHTNNIDIVEVGKSVDEGHNHVNEVVDDNDVLYSSEPPL